ncbi:XXYS1_4_G0012200.mRNA.1.CDS.1 [Saccharomyces cerevisiae]|nr:EM14S01-3B_G0009550.mRNA.1.CDS.1 [Saccharomyces cerevisiae]CAD6643944.1 XXYS1_4_G0012200.mRNA.1.CDS.1 [Saccharomyces cerevisiae]CAI4719042.1 CEI_1a_G0043930.mRNA.1.CDS.1 [Saccharomyces cerevisiae]CAI4720154.1 AMH_1a_G0044030.mRNA.1.CDS.1 [Saccharomyces cerevisiae]CAI6852925.1 AMH_1a_G0044030.mRNA.1.CDS.1 [Saccharomyces cerevisiae]
MTLAHYGQPVKMCHILPPLRSLPVLVEKKTEKKKSQITNNHVIFLFILLIKLLLKHTIE